MFKKHKITPKPSFQVLPNNRLDKEVKEIAYTFNFAYNLLFSSKYCIRDNHIYPNGRKHYWLSFCYLVVITMLSIYRMMFSVHKRLEFNASNNLGKSFAVLFTIVYFISDGIGFTMLFILDIVHKYNYVSLLLSIQTIHRSINISKSVRSYITWNWVSLLTAICFDILAALIQYKMAAGRSEFIGSIPILIIDLAFTTFHVNSMVAIRLIILLRKYLEAWIDEVLLIKDDEASDEQCLKLFEKYQYILNTYNLYKTIFQALVLYQIYQAFFRIIAYLDLLFYSLLSLFSKSGKHTIPKSMFVDIGVLTVVYLTKHIICVIIHSMYCEKFYKTVEEAKTTCIQLMKNRDCPKSQKYLCKNVILTNRSFSKMSACGLFYVDATLIRSLVAVIINNVIVILQFFFL